MKLKNKAAVVTGCARGIGQAIAVKLAKEGANLLINDIYEFTRFFNFRRNQMRHNLSL